MPRRSDTGPFAIVPLWLMDADVSDRGVFLYALLGAYADRNGEAFPSHATLAKRLRCSVGSVKRALRELVKVRALKIEQRRSPDGDLDTNLYHVIRAAPVTLPQITDDPTPQITGDLENQIHPEPTPSLGDPDGSPQEGHGERQPIETIGHLIEQCHRARGNGDKVGRLVDLARAEGYLDTAPGVWASIVAPTKGPAPPMQRILSLIGEATHGPNRVVVLETWVKERLKHGDRNEAAGRRPAGGSARAAGGADVDRARTDW